MPAPPPVPSDVAALDHDATPAVVAAHRGLRRDVEALIGALEKAPLLVPLARRMPDSLPGITQEVGTELSLSPHLLFDDQRLGYVAVFTRADLVERATDRVGWTTDDGPLEFCTLPAFIVLEMAVALLEDRRMGGLLLNPFDESELLLRRPEVASLAQRRALPLVGYVADIPHGDDEERLIAEMESPPAAALTSAIEAVLARTQGTAGYSLYRTFNAERDIEPHLTLNVLVEDDDLDRTALAQALARSVEGELPPPGYIDILFNDPLLRPR